MSQSQVEPTAVACEPPRSPSMETRSASFSSNPSFMHLPSPGSASDDEVARHSHASKDAFNFLVRGIASMPSSPFNSTENLYPTRTMSIRSSMSPSSSPLSITNLDLSSGLSLSSVPEASEASHPDSPHSGERSPPYSSYSTHSLHSSWSGSSGSGTGSGGLAEKFRVCFIGAQCGKSCLIHRILKGVFYTGDDPTVEDHHLHRFLIDDQPCEVDLIDTSGNDTYKHLLGKWFSGGSPADAFVLVFSFTSIYSFDMIRVYYEEIMKVRDHKPPVFILVATRVDESDMMREVSTIEGISMATTLGCRFLEVSAKTGEHVEKVLPEVVRSLRSKRQQEAEKESKLRQLRGAVSAVVAEEPSPPKGRKTSTDVRKWLGIGGGSSPPSKAGKAGLKPSASSPAVASSLTAMYRRSSGSTAVYHMYQFKMQQLLLLRELRSEPSNRSCADCSSDYPDWISLGLMTLVCVQCATVHKKYLTALTRVKCLLLDPISNEEMEPVKLCSNARANQIWEARVVPGKKRPVPRDSRDRKVEFIKAKYIEREFMAPAGMKGTTNKWKFEYKNKLEIKRGKEMVPAKKLKLLPSAVLQPLVYITAPRPEDIVSDKVEETTFPYLAGEIVSTYPMSREVPGRPEGSPICDRFSVAVYPDKLIVAIADGCSWGPKPRDAALKASDGFMKTIINHHMSCKTVADISDMLIRGFSNAQDAITASSDSESTLNYWEVGTTTLLGGMLMKLDVKEKDSAPDHATRWAFVCASVGDCKAFSFSPQSGQVREVTEGSRPLVLDASDCGGRLGPQIEGQGPDLRNFQIFVDVSLQENDMIILMSDGVHDNLDPMMIGVNPQTLNQPFVDWLDFVESAGVAAEKVKDSYRIRKLGELLAGLTTPREISAKLIDHCQQTTLKAKTYMEVEGKPQPKDYVNFPGKMDHTSCMCVQVSSNFSISSLVPSSYAVPLAGAPARR
eukprot:TRINITY_DN820_c0_g1_i2.p1 TRINITY_DN820_c0_g1~~TRINITY_DN820_c0_g1_i2.p1  ORF type:complete len:956 (+),score=243.32 TRINITY_DN820_c0_g1_i2:188-3055(+)